MQLSFLGDCHFQHKTGHSTLAIGVISYFTTKWPCAYNGRQMTQGEMNIATKQPAIVIERQILWSGQNPILHKKIQNRISQSWIICFF